MQYLKKKNQKPLKKALDKMTEGQNILSFLFSSKTVLGRTEWDGMGWDGMGWDGMAMDLRLGLSELLEGSIILSVFGF